MIPGIVPIPAGKSGPSIFYRQLRVSSAPGLGVAFTNTTLGDPDPTRLIVVMVNYWRFDTSAFLSSVSVAGVALTIIGPYSQGFSGDFFYSAMAYGRVPNGATGTVSVSFSTRGPNDLGVGVWSLYDVANTAPVVNVVNNFASGGRAMPLSANVQVGDVVVAGAAYGYNIANSWVGLTERYDTIVVNRQYSGADYAATATETPRAFRYDYGAGYAVAQLGVWR